MQEFEDVTVALHAVHERYTTTLLSLEAQARTAHARRIDDARQLRNPEQDICTLTTADTDLATALADARRVALAQRDADLLAQRDQANAVLTRANAQLADLRRTWRGDRLIAFADALATVRAELLACETVGDMMALHADAARNDPANALAAAIDEYRAMAKQYRTSAEALAALHARGGASIDRWLAPAASQDVPPVVKVTVGYDNPGVVEQPSPSRALPNAAPTAVAEAA